MSRFTNHDKRHAMVAKARFNVVIQMTTGINELLETAKNGSEEHGMILENAALLLCGYPAIGNAMLDAWRFLFQCSLVTPADINFLELFNPGFFQHVA